VTTREATTKEALHRLVEAIPEGGLDAARQALEPLADPFLLALANAEIDHEPETDEERALVAEADDDIAHGRVRDWEDVRRELVDE
jgi:hypothetical protein